MKWYRFFTSSDDGTTVTVKSGITLAITDAITAASMAISGAFGVSGQASFILPPQIVGSADAGVGKKMLTLGTGAGPTVDFHIGDGFTAAGPTPVHAGDIYINTTTGKIYVASAATATTDWKIVTSA